MLNLVWLLFLQVGGDTGAIAHLAEANTAYRLALDTEHSVAHLQSAQRLYEAAEKELLKRPLQNQLPWLRIAQAGGKQSEGRLENAESAFRNVVPLAWWLGGNHDAYEWDDDAMDAAVDRALDRLGKSFVLKDPVRIGVYARCRAPSSSCAAIRDMVLAYAASHQNLFGLSDDKLAEHGDLDAFLRGAGTRPETDRSSRLYSGLGMDKILVVDVLGASHTIAGDSVSHAAVTAWLWDLAGGKVTRFSDVEATSVDRTKQRSNDFIFGAIILLVSLILGVLYPPISKQLPRAVMLAVVAVIIGVLVEQALAQAIDPLLLAMDAHAHSPSGGVIASAIVWPLSAAVSLAIFPMALSLLLPWLVRLRYNADWLDGVLWHRLTPHMYIGACGAFVVSLPGLMGTPGWWLASSFVALALLFAMALQRPLDRYFSSDQDSAERDFSIMAAGTLCLAVLLAVWMFQSVVVGDLWVARALVLAALVLSLVLAVLGWSGHQAGETSSGDSVVQSGDQGLVAAFSLLRPAYVMGSSAKWKPTDLTRSALEAAPASLVTIVGEAGSGRSRATEFALDTLVGLMPEARRSQVVGEDDHCEPFQTATQLLDFFAVAKRRGALEGQAKVAQSVQGHAVDLLQTLPGVALLLQSADHGSAQQLSRDQLMREVVVAVRAQAMESPLIFAIDDVHAIDEDSRELLGRLLTSLSKSPAKHPVVLIQSVLAEAQSQVISSAAGTGDFHWELGELSRPDLSLLLRHAGAGELLKSAAWIAGIEQISTRPSYVLLLLRNLVAKERATRSSNGTLVFDKSCLDALEYGELELPSDLISAYRVMLDGLSEDEEWLLELTARCGRRFSVDELASGLRIDRLPLLRQLETIDRQWDLLEDLDEENHFCFRSEAARQALLQRAAERRTRGAAEGLEHTPEMVREFHLRIAMFLRQQAKANPQRVLFHGLKAGQRFAQDLPEVIVSAAEQDLGRCAFRRVAERLELWLEHVRVDIDADLHLRHDLLKARCLRGEGGQQRRDQAIALFHQAVLRLSDADREFRVMCDLMEVIYEEKDKGELQELLKSADAWLANTAWKNPLTPCCVRFYRELARYQLFPGRATDEQKAASDATLKRIEIELSTFVASPDSDLLRARIIQERAGRQTGNEPLRRERFIALCEVSRRLKQQHNDQQGLALTLGVMGQDYLYYKPQDFTRAHDLLQGDLELTSGMGKQGECVGLYNKLGMAKWGQALACEDSSQARKLQVEALELCLKSLRMALEFEREIDLAFAGNSVLQYALELDEKRGTDEALEALLDERMDTYAKIPFAFPKDQFRELVPLLSEHGFTSQAERVLVRIDASIPKVVGGAHDST